MKSEQNNEIPDSIQWASVTSQTHGVGVLDHPVNKSSTLLWCNPPGRCHAGDCQQAHGEIEQIEKEKERTAWSVLPLCECAAVVVLATERARLDHMYVENTYKDTTIL